MKSPQLTGLLSSQLNAALSKARGDYSDLMSDVNTIAAQIGKAYRFGELHAPGINSHKCLEKLPEGKPKAEAISHYQGHAHATLTQVALNAARRLHRQKRPVEDFAALQVAIDLLRFIVNARADMARLEAFACEGPFAFPTPQVDSFHQVEARLGKQAQSVFTRLQACPSPQDIVQMSVGRARIELAKPQNRVRTALNRAEEKARHQGNGKHLKQVQDCRAALKEAEQAAQAADPFSINEVGAAVQKYYGVMNRYPWYFGLPNRQSNGGNQGQSAPDSANKPDANKPVADKPVADKEETRENPQAKNREA